MSEALAERYELVEQIGRGGMASVWRAKVRGFAGFERTCVIKRVLRGQGPDDEDKVAMFVREARLCALLSHRNIVQVFDFGIADGEYYLAMEYVDGRDLLDLCRTMEGKLPPPGAVAFVVRELCRALAYAHELVDPEGRPLGLVHRDVSPSNVIVAADGSVKLLDFGVAKAVSHETSLTRLGTIKGKLSYMSPEQVAGGELDGRSDVFAVGILLHEMLCMRRLFRGKDDEDTVQRLLRMEIPAPSTIHPDVPPELDEICLRALSRDRSVRYQSAAEMADALEPIVRDHGWGAGRMSRWLRDLPPSTPRGEDATAEPTDVDGEVDAAVVEAARAASGVRPLEHTPTRVTHEMAAEPTRQYGRGGVVWILVGLMLSVALFTVVAAATVLLRDRAGATAPSR